MAVSAPAPAPNNPAAPAANKTKKRGRAVGSVAWNEIEGLVAFKALCHADEKHSASSKDERYKNAKDYYDSTIVSSRAWGVWDPEPASGSKTPEQSIRLRTGDQIYARGKNLFKWLNKETAGFADEWYSPGADGTETYDFQPSGCNDAFEWWAMCEEKVFEDLRAKHKGIPAELKLTFRYVCPDSPYLSADAASGANDALPNVALQFFSSGDKRFYIDPNKRLESCNKGATQQAQKLLARATASLGCDPRTPGVFAMEPAVPKPTPQQQQLTVQLYRVAWGFEQFLASTGIDMSKAPELPPQEPAPAASPEEVAFGSGAPAGHRELASGTGDAQGATQGDPAGDADSSDDEGAGLGEDANRDGGDDSGDDSGDDDGDDGDGDNTPPSPPSPGEMHATQRRASTRARKAPRRSL
jgi:hypothetical protein